MHSKFYVHRKKVRDYFRAVSKAFCCVVIVLCTFACYNFWLVENAIDHFRDRMHTAVRNI